MKRITLILTCFVGVVFLTSCATPPPTSQESLKPNPTDKIALERHVEKKIAALSETELIAVNEFVDQSLRSRHSGKDILIMGIEDSDWPFYLEEIMRSNIFLNSLPREKKRLVFRESRRTPGVVNVYYLVQDSNVPKGEHHPLNWFPGEDVWNKFVDAKANNLADLNEKQVFLTLFTEANKDQNPELILAVKGTDNKWDWRRMPHPKQTVTKEMLVPLLTVQNAGVARILAHQ